MKFLLLTGLLIFVTCAGAKPSLGLQTWTCRNLSFEEMVAFAVAHRIDRVQLINTHVNPNDPPDVNRQKQSLLQERGITAYSMYAVTGISTQSDRRIFETAQLFGMKFVVVEPKSMEMWPGLFALAREFGIKLAVHNHGKGTPYSDPSAVHQLLTEYRDLGVCLDVAWVSVTGHDAAEVFLSYGDRLLDIHFRDMCIEANEDGAKVVDTEPGKGQVNFDGLFDAIRESGWSGTLAIETDQKEYRDNPGPLVNLFRHFFVHKYPRQ